MSTFYIPCYFPSSVLFPPSSRPPTHPPPPPPIPPPMVCYRPHLLRTSSNSLLFLRIRVKVLL
eukprot:51081-Pyramimonas_sp.AAC.1